MRRLLIPLVQIGLVLAVLANWEFGGYDEFFFSKPSSVLGRIEQWLADGTMWADLGVTLTEAGLALLIGTAAGLVVGLALGRVKFLGAVFSPFIKALNALPRVVLAPLFLLWFGLGVWSKVAFGVTLVFFVVFLNTYQGVRQVRRALVDNARMLGATETQLVRHVMLPSALSWIFASLHLSVGFALVGAVVGEYLGAAAGMGYLISQAQGTLDTTGVFAGIAVLTVVVLLVDFGVGLVERELLRWKPEEQ
ncbi:ABC transporter permease [Kutzneria buriramensis]|uniref:NitT/TauT family transport system permease protein n=1 Tax=Kutzneria buriramensis TaxID=1045776 RepID=A0A3E0GWN4_9PSEU|nr:ABC transporter permease [Kutzneria buriramensis]REH28583.1 NitT/TauT family transport system permease protein [Kutzneria buriramensis]